MKARVKRVLKVAKHQVYQLIRLINGEKLTTISLTSMTLDWDDVSLAWELIHNPFTWDDDQYILSYEREFASWNGSKYAFAFMGGRVALSACIDALDLQPDDEVILPAYTCVVVPNAFHYAGVKTVYSDIELETYGLDVSQLKEKITSKTRAILLHHLYGLVCRDYERIIEFSKTYNLRVIEDCAHSTGAKYKGKNVGNYGDVAFYSSEQSKVFNTIQGGIAVTNDDELADKIEAYQARACYPDKERISKLLYNVIINYYQRKHRLRLMLGDLAYIQYGDKILQSTTLKESRGIRPVYYGQKMPSPIARLGLNQFKKIGTYNQKRRKTAQKWEEWCDVNEYRKPMVINDSFPIYLRYPVLVEPEKKQDAAWAKDLGIELGQWFITHIHPSQSLSGFPNADKAVQQCINFPCILS